MASTIEKLKLLLDWLKFLIANRWILRTIISLVPIAGGYIYHQTSVIADQDQQIQGQTKQIAGLGTVLSQEVIKPKIAPRETKVIYQKVDYTPLKKWCDDEIDRKIENHVRIYHR